MATRDIRFDFSKEYPLPSDEQRTGVLAKANGADCAQVVVHGVPFIIRSPSPEAWLRYVEGRKASGVRAGQQFAIDCVLWPETETLHKIMARFPVIVGPLNDEISALGGGDDSPLAKLL